MADLVHDWRAALITSHSNLFQAPGGDLGTAIDAAKPLAATPARATVWRLVAKATAA
jgi:hypothetical protein